MAGLEAGFVAAVDTGSIVDKSAAGMDHNQGIVGNIADTVVVVVVDTIVRVLAQQLQVQLGVED